MSQRQLLTQDHERLLATQRGLSCMSRSSLLHERKAPEPEPPFGDAFLQHAELQRLSFCWPDARVRKRRRRRRLARLTRESHLQNGANASCGTCWHDLQNFHVRSKVAIQTAAVASSS
ncbi:unnamed protein product [Symbiodinium natans]|uniref:Uncharacterized protein n=1 Tax=Symbiodinium natans TaxID=878477 RepID=A0A812JAJ3_9DINO|nr:unnamed protein product [Symbiodinium natans]